MDVRAPSEMTDYTDKPRLAHHPTLTDCSSFCTPQNCAKVAAEVEESMAEQIVVPEQKHTSAIACGSDCTPLNCRVKRARLINSGRIVDVGGGKFQSKIKYGFDKFDPASLKEVSIVLQRGAEIYGVDAWHGETVSHHVNHAIFHLYEYLAGEMNEKHLVNAFCRVMFALGVDLKLGEESATKRSGMRFATEEPEGGQE